MAALVVLGNLVLMALIAWTAFAGSGPAGGSFTSSRVHPSPYDGSDGSFHNGGAPPAAGGGGSRLQMSATARSVAAAWGALSGSFTTSKRPAARSATARPVAAAPAAAAAATGALRVCPSVGPPPIKVVSARGPDGGAAGGGRDTAPSRDAGAGAGGAARPASGSPTDDAGAAACWSGGSSDGGAPARGAAAQPSPPNSSDDGDAAVVFEAPTYAPPDHLGLLLQSSFTARGPAADDQAGQAPTELLKVLVRFMQYLLLVGATNAPWPRLVSALFQAMQVVVGASNQGVVSIDCLLRPAAALPVAAQEALLQLALPLALLAALLAAAALMSVISQLVARGGGGGAAKLLPQQAAAAVVVTSGAAISHYRTAQPPARGLRPRVSLSALKASMADAAPRLAAATIYILFPHLIRVSLSAFACITADTGAGKYYANAAAAGQFWVHDTSQRCWVGWHRLWALSVGVAGTLLFCVAAPAALAALLLLHGPGRRRGGGAGARRFGIFFGAYRRRRWWWEIVVCAQTELIVAVSVMAPMLGAYASLLLLTSLFVASLTLQLLARPHRHGSTHAVQLSAWAILTAACMATLGLFNPATMAGDGAASSRAARFTAAFSSVLGVTLVVIVAAFIALTCAAAAWRLRVAARRAVGCMVRACRRGGGGGGGGGCFGRRGAAAE